MQVDLFRMKSLCWKVKHLRVIISGVHTNAGTGCLKKATGVWIWRNADFSIELLCFCALNKLHFGSFCLLIHFHDFVQFMQLIV